MKKLSFFLFISLICLSLTAQTNYYWNGGSITASPANGGTGTWSTTNAWRTISATGSQATWANTNNAIIAGTPAGTISITGAESPALTTVNTTGYVLTPSNSTADAFAGNISLAAGVNLTLNDPTVTGTSGSSARTLDLTGSTYSGGTGSTLTVGGGQGASISNYSAVVVQTVAGATVSVPVIMNGTGSGGYVAFGYNPASGSGTCTLSGGVQIPSTDVASVVLGCTAGFTISIAGITGSSSSQTAPVVISNKPTGSGAGLAILTGTSNYYGPTYLEFNSGTFSATGSVLRCGANNTLSPNSVLNFGPVPGGTAAQGGNLDLFGSDETVAGLATTTSPAGYANTVIGNTASATVSGTAATTSNTLTVNQVSNTSYSGKIQDGTGSTVIYTALTKSGTGILTLTGANTYTGATTVNAGSLLINGSLGASLVSVGSSGTLGGNGTTAGTVSLTGTVSPGSAASTIGALNTGAITFNANSSYTFEVSNAGGVAGTGYDEIVSTGAITCSASPITINITSLSGITFSNTTGYTWTIASGTSVSGFNASHFTLNTTNFIPALNGSFNIAQVGNTIVINYVPNVPSLIPSPAALAGLNYVFGNTPGASATGSFTLSGSNLTAGGGTITISSLGTNYLVSTTSATSGFGTTATLSYTGTGTISPNTVWVQLASGLVAGTYNSQTINITGGGVLTTPATVTVSGYVTGIYYWNGSNSSTLSSTWDNTSLNWSTPTALPVLASAWPASGSNPIAYFSGSGGGTVTLPNTLAAVPANIVIGSSTYTFAGTNPVITSTISLGSTDTLHFAPTGATAGIQGVISGAGSIDYNGSTGTTTIPSSLINTYTGPTVIDNTAVLVVGADANLGTAPGTPTAGNIVIKGGGSLTTTPFFTINANRGIALDNNTSNVISVTSGGSISTYNGIIADLPSNQGSWNKQGKGTLVLGGNSTYTGETYLNNGIIQNTINNALPTGTLVSFGQTSGNTGELDLNGYNQTVAGLEHVIATTTPTAKNTVTTTTGSSILTIGGIGTYVFGSTLSEADNSGIITGAVSVVMNGTGSQTLGDANTYTGTTTVTNGSLLIDGSTASGSSVSVGTNGILGGNGTVGGTVSLTGIVSPGSAASAIGALSTGNFTFNANSTYQLEVTDASGAAGIGYDELISTGSITCSASPITIDITSLAGIAFSYTGSYSWTIASAASISGFNTSHFNIITTHFTPSLNGGTFAISQVSNTLVLTFTPSLASLTPSVSSLSGFNYVYGSGPSASQSFTLAGLNLTAGTGTITINATGTNYLVSTTSATSGFGTTATLSYTGPATISPNTVWVELAAGLTVGTYNGQVINIYGGGVTSATPATVTVNGSVDGSYYWNGSNTTALNGTWSNTGTNWSSPTATTTLNATWPTTGTDHSAYFTAIGGGTVTLPNAMTSLGAVPASIVIGSNAFTFAGTNPVITCPVTLNSGDTMHFAPTGATAGIQGVVSGAGSITYNGAGTTVIPSTLTNTYSGVTTINAGVLSIAADGNLGAIPGTATAGSIVINGGRLTSATNGTTISANRGIELGIAASSSSISITGSGSVTTYDGIMSDLTTGGTWAKQGGGTFVLGGNSTYTGSTLLNNGIIQLAINDALPTVSTSVLNLGQSASANVGTFDMNGYNQHLGGLGSTSGTNATASKNTVTSTTGSSTLTINGSGTYSYGVGTAANSGVITGPVSLVLNGSVTQTLGDVNTYTGTTSILGTSTLQISADDNIGAAPGSATAGSIIINGGSLTTIASFTLNANRGIALASTSGTTISTSGATTVTTYNGIMADLAGYTPGSLSKQGKGTLVLGGASTYTGTTYLNNGIVQLGIANALPATTLLNFGQNNGNVGELDLNGKNQSVLGLTSSTAITTPTGKNTITCSTGAATLTLTGTGSYVFGSSGSSEADNSGVITGAVSLVINGTGGSQTLGDANTYTGTTTVSAGTLFINGSTSASSAVTVASGAKLAGNGTAAGTVSLTGEVSPGAAGSTIGVLTTGTFTFNSGSSYKFEVSNATGTAGIGWDEIVSTGAITCSASPITIDLASLSGLTNFSSGTPYTWTIATGTSIVGFSAANFSVDDANFSAAHTGVFTIVQSGNNINLVYTPGANTWTGAVNNVWTIPGNWTTAVPSCTVDGVIPQNLTTYPVITTSVSIRNLTIQADAYVTMSSAGTLSVCGNVSAASAQSWSGSVVLQGTGAQTLSAGSTISMGNLEVNGNYTISSGQVSVAGILNKAGGTLNTNNNLTLTANSAQTALIAENGGSLAGDVTMQQYVHGNTGYHHISSPMSSSTVGNLSGVFISGTNGVGSFIHNEEGTLEEYTEAANAHAETDSGYYNYTSLSNPLTPGVGYTALFYPPATLGTYGSPNNGAVSVTVTNTAGHAAGVEGWNFVGNPYPSPISWSAVKTLNSGLAINGSCYIWVASTPTSGTWTGYNGTAGTGGVGNVIASSQGFWVDVTSAGSHTLNFSNAVRTQDLSPMFYKAPDMLSNELRLNISSANDAGSEALMYTEATGEGSAAIPPMQSFITSPTITYINADNNEHDMIYVASSIDENTEIPLAIHIGAAGSYAISALSINVSGMPVYILNKATGTYYDMSSQTVTINSQGNDNINGRYSVVYNRKTKAAAANTVNIYGKSAAIEVERMNGDDPAQVIVTDMLGREVANRTAPGSSIEIPVADAYAIYMVTVISGDIRTVKKVIVKE